MIKLKDELVNFPLIDINALSKKKSFPENIRTAVTLYNKAIDRIKFNSSDIAVIELKKAIKMFPEFYDAVLLLSLCYYTNDEKAKAINLLNSIKDDDERNKCFKYLDSVVGKSVSGSKQIRRAAESTVHKSTQGNNRSRSQAGKRNSQHSQRNNRTMSYYIKTALKNFLSNPVVFRITALMAVLIIIFGMGYGLYTLYNVNKSKRDLNSQVDDYKRQYERADADAQKIRDDLMTARKREEQLISGYIIDWLVGLERDIESEYKTIVEVIYLIDKTVITDNEQLQKIELLNTKALTIYVEKVYNSAEHEYMVQNYYNAINQYESIIKYHPGYQQIMKVYLALARAYRDVGNAEDRDEYRNMAIEKYEYIIEFYSQYEEGHAARNELAEVKETYIPASTPTGTPGETSTGTPGNENGNTTQSANGE